MSAGTLIDPAEVVGMQPGEPDRRDARRRARSERGAVIAEFAFVAPVLFVLLFGFLELGLLVVGSAVGTNAAREGAREGVIQYLDADTDGSTAFAAIEAAVTDKLASLVDTDDVQVAVRCLDYDDVDAGAADPAIDCDPSEVEPGRDLLEVSVTWRPIVLTGFVGPDRRTDRARMTIVSRSPGGSTATPSSDSSLPSVSLGCSPTALTETNGNQTVTCTVTRSTMSGSPSVGFHVTDGAATSGADYTAASGSMLTFAPGSASTTFTVTVHGDTSFEPTEDFTISLVGPMAAVLGSPSSHRITIANDDPADSSPPAVQSVRLEDSRGTPNGKIDTIRIGFDEALGGCAATGISVSGLPAGYSVDTVTKSGSSVVVSLVEGSTYVTSVGAIQVSHSGGLCDAAGNAVAPFTRTPTDAAAPYLVAITAANAQGGTARRPETGDTLTFTFTEPVQAPAPGTLVLARDNGSGKFTDLTIGSLLGPVTLPDSNTYTWFDGNEQGGRSTATFPTTVSVAGNAFVLTLGACTGSCDFVAGPGTITIPGFAWSTGSAPRDAAGNVAPNPVAPPASAIPFTGIALF